MSLKVDGEAVCCSKVLDIIYGERDPIHTSLGY